MLAKVSYHSKSLIFAQISVSYVIIVHNLSIIDAKGVRVKYINVQDVL